MAIRFDWDTSPIVQQLDRYYAPNDGSNDPESETMLVILCPDCAAKRRREARAEAVRQISHNPALLGQIEIFPVLAERLDDATEYDSECADCHGGIDARDEVAYLSEGADD